MAMGLKLLGRGRTVSLAQRRITVFIIHVFSAAVGGMIAGFLLSLIGKAFSLNNWRLELLVLVTACTVGLGLAKPHQKLGLQRQVPRLWVHTMEPRQRFALWGLLLGSGVATSIPYSAIVVLFAAQITAPTVWAMAAGAVFGLTRELLAALPLIVGADLDQMMDALITLRAMMQRANVLIGLVGGCLLLLGLLN